MKRKRKIGMPNNENDRPDMHSEINTSGGNEGRQTQSISRDHYLAQNASQSPVPMGSVFKRLFVGLDPKLKTKIDSNICHSNITPETPSTKRRYVLAESSKSTAINTTESNIQRNQRKNKRIALDDITNLASRELITNCTPTPPRVSKETEQVARTSDQGSCLSSVKYSDSESDIDCVHHSDGENIFPNEPESNKMSSSIRANVAHKSLKKKPVAKSLGSILSYLD
ncbi:hypothetical protein Bca101_010481 [Brassica carinata]